MQLCYVWNNTYYVFRSKNFRLTIIKGLIQWKYTLSRTLFFIYKYNDFGIAKVSIPFLYENVLKNYLGFDSLPHVQLN